MLVSPEESIFGGAELTEARPLRRTALEMRLDVLQIIASGVEVPTQIMYKANLSWNTMMGHVKQLVETGYAYEVAVDDRKRYRLTERGVQALAGRRTESRID